MKIVVMKPFSGYKVGQQFDWSDGMARILIARGLIAEDFGGPQENAVEVAAVQPKEERAVMQQHRKKFK